MRFRGVLLPVALITSACFDPTKPGGSGEAGGSTETTATDPTTTATTEPGDSSDASVTMTTADSSGSSTGATSTGTTEDPSVGDSSSTGVAPGCGDGELGPDEECDDGDAVDDNGCNTNCEPSGQLMWVVVDGDTDEDLGGGITNDGDGNVFATGTLFRDGIDEDIWVGSWAADGTERFVLLYDISQGGYERGRDISLGPNDGLLVVADGQAGGRIVRVDSDGTFQSDAALLGEAGASYSPTAITVSPSGFYSVGMDLVGPNTLPAALRLSNFVQVLWSRDDAQGPAASARYTSVAADALDDAYACGISGAQGFIHKRLSASGDLDQIVDALPPLSGIGVAGNGDLVVAGPRFVNGQGDNLWVSRRGPDGADAVWEFDVDGGDNLDDRVAGVAIDPNDRIVVAGSATGDAAADAIVIKLDGDGAVLWSTRGSAAEGSSAYNDVSDVAVDANGDVSVVGTFFGDTGDGQIFVAHFAR